MDQQLVRDTIVYLSMIFATVVVFSVLMWVVSFACRRRLRYRRCTALTTIGAAIVGLGLWSALMQLVVPGQEFLGPWWWFAFVAIPATFSVSASSLILWRGPDRRWQAKDHVRTAVGSLLCGLLGLILVWQQTDHIWGWATAMAGCGPVTGTVDFVSHRETYGRLWWGDPEIWSTAKCAGRLDQKISADNDGAYQTPAAADPND